MTTTATYTKLKDGTWGVRAPAGVVAGDRLTITKRDGSSKVETVERVLWTGTAKDGLAASLVTVARSARSNYEGGNRAPRGRSCPYCRSRSCAKAWDSADLCEQD